MTSRPTRFVRGALSGLFFLVYGLFALPFAVILPFLPKRWGRWAVRFFYRLFVFAARMTGVYRVVFAEGSREALAALRGRIVVMNHVSLIDICVLLSFIPDAVCIAKAAAKRNPFLSAVVRRLFIANDRGPEETVTEVRGYLSRGVNVVVFPQGTRGGGKLHRGAARLALASGTEIAAVRIDYDPVILAKGQPWWDVGDRIITIRLAFRGMLTPEGEDSHRNAVALTERIAALIGRSR